MVDLRSVGLGVLCWPLLWVFFLHNQIPQPQQGHGWGVWRIFIPKAFYVVHIFCPFWFHRDGFHWDGQPAWKRSFPAARPLSRCSRVWPPRWWPGTRADDAILLFRRASTFLFQLFGHFFFVQPIPNKEKNHSSSFPASLWSSQGLPPAPTCNAAFIFEPFEGCLANIPAKSQHRNLPFKFDPVPMWVFFTHGCHRLVYRGRGRLPGSHAGLVAPNQAALQSHAAALGLAPQATVSRAIYPPPRKGPRLSGSGGRQRVGRGRGVGTPMPLEPLWDPRVDHPPFQGICRSTAIALRPRGEWGGIIVHFSPFLAPKGDGSVF